MDAMTIKAGLDLAKFLKDWIPKGPNDKDVQDQIRVALRTFYFTPRGIIALLKRIEAGDKIPAEELSRALIEFNDGEPAVERAAHHLEFERLHREYGVSLRTVQNLELVRYGKLSLRRKIQDEINYYGRPRVKPDVDRVKRLLAEIESLNSRILDAEETFAASKQR